MESEELNMEQKLWKFPDGKMEQTWMTFGWRFPSGMGRASAPKARVQCE
jgi:hypothetical protein